MKFFFHRFFETAAIGTLETMKSNSHIFITYCVLLKNVELYNVDCLQMAMICDCKRFVSQPIIQSLFENIWWAGMKHHQLEHILLIKVLFFYCLIEFK